MILKTTERVLFFLLGVSCARTQERTVEKVAQPGSCAVFRMDGLCEAGTQTASAVPERHADRTLQPEFQCIVAVAEGSS